MLQVLITQCCLSCFGSLGSLSFIADQFACFPLLMKDLPLLF
jgi:hypothetical protein